MPIEEREEIDRRRHASSLSEPDHEAASREPRQCGRQRSASDRLENDIHSFRRIADIEHDALSSELERDGLVLRRVYHTVPVQTEYELTALGKSLAEIVGVIRTWAYDNVEIIKRSRDVYDSTRT